MIVLASVALAGCASLAPPATTPGTTPATTPATTPSSTPVSKLQIAQATHEYPSPPAPAQTVAAATAGAEQAVRAFAAGYINWTASSVAADMRRLASQSVGQARSAMQMAAAQTANDYELQRGGIANSGTVEAIAPLSGRSDQYVVVTRERTSATNSGAYAGLAPAWHVALASVERVAGGWAVSGWQPEN